MQILRGRRSAAYRLAISQDSRFVAAAGPEDLHIWDLDEPATKPVRGAVATAYTLQFLGDGRLVFNEDAEWQVIDVVTGQSSGWSPAVEVEAEAVRAATLVQGDRFLTPRAITPDGAS